MYEQLRPILFTLDAETSHGLTLAGLNLAYRTGLLGLLTSKMHSFPVDAFGITFPNPVGLAAGLDKNGDYIDALAALGFGFIEIGTVTPQAQPGNMKPRLFRVPKHSAIINRMGFNNAGVDVLLQHLRKSTYTGVIGVNIGKNRDTPNDRAVADYLFCLERVYTYARYITVNISSPNTEGLRDLQQAEHLRGFISTLREAQERLGSQSGTRKPMLLKIAPDLTDTDMDTISSILLASDIDGVICTNTTIEHTHVAHAKNGQEMGGVSGKPLFEQSNTVLSGMRQRLGSTVPLIGVGGILSGADANAKMNAGASLIQLYSGLIYRGPDLIRECVEHIRNHQGCR